MGLLYLHRFSTAGTSSRNLGYADQGFGPSRAGPDDQLIADCHSLMCQIGTLLNEIERAAEAKGPEQGRRQASLCEADDQAFDLMERIADTRAVTPCGVQSKHAAAVFLLSIEPAARLARHHCRRAAQPVAGRGPPGLRPRRAGLRRRRWSEAVPGRARCERTPSPIHPRAAFIMHCNSCITHHDA